MGGSKNNSRGTLGVMSKIDVLVGFCVFFFLFFKFIYFFLRETEWEKGGEGGRERIPGRLCTFSTVGCRAQTHETLRSWPEVKPRGGRLTDWATRAPQVLRLPMWSRIHTDVVLNLLILHSKYLHLFSWMSLAYNLSVSFFLFCFDLKVLAHLKTNPKKQLISRGCI